MNTTNSKALDWSSYSMSRLAKINPRATFLSKKARFRVGTCDLGVLNAGFSQAYAMISHAKM
jgi:hypothetical protein